MKLPPIVSPEEWEAARQELLVEEKALMKERDALAAKRRRMPWMAVDKEYRFEGPTGPASLGDLFQGRRQLIVYRAFYAPAESRYRVFIVDEAHMVTSAGFNALLKIVEEPPEHLIFIFATTEPEKVLPTIRSRTHHYPFRLLAPTTMRGLLEKICHQEQ